MLSANQKRDNEFNVYYNTKEQLGCQYDTAVLRWLTTVFLTLSRTCYHCLPDISISCTCRNDASNPKNTGKPLQHLKDDKSFSIGRNSFKLCPNMCITLRPEKYDKNTPVKEL